MRLWSLFDLFGDGLSTSMTTGTSSGGDKETLNSVGGKSESDDSTLVIVVSGSGIF